MRRLANAYLIAFAVDAALSVVDDQLRLLLGSSPLALTRSAVAWVVLAATLPVFLGVLATPRLRPSVFLPPAAFFGWVSLGAMPLPLYLDWTILGPGLSWAQLGLAAAILLRARTLAGGRSWLLDERAWRAPAWRPAYTARTVALSAIGGPLLLVAYLGMSALLAIDVMTAGFVRVAPDGVYTEQREYRRGEQRVYLVGMIHLADREFYRRVLEGIAEPGTAVLIEGVRNDRGAADLRLSHGPLAESLGLAAQEDHLILPADDGIEVIRADVDLADFSPETIALLSEAMRVFGQDSAREALLAYLELLREPRSTADVESFWREVVHDRDAHVFGELERALTSYARAVLPWGAAHMPGLESRLLEAGFEPGESRELRVVAF